MHGTDSLDRSRTAPEIARMKEVLARQRAAHEADMVPSAATRIGRINRAIGLLVDHKDEIAAALAADFGHRSRDQSLLTDIVAAIGPLKHARAHLKSWMRPVRRRTEFPLGLLGASATIHWQPKGVVGLISPWNFPVQLTFAPLADILAAGNRVMIKPSEYTPHTSALMQRLIREAFDEAEIALFTGGPEVGQAFTHLPFDHLLFTGATSVGRHVMRAAADNLVPVTLELGGKSPVLIGAGADIGAAAGAIAAGKMMNAGQICLAPDYVLLPRATIDAFVDATEAAVRAMYPTLKDNPDYTSIVNQRHYDRLQDYLAEAKARGVRHHEINPAREDFSQTPTHKMPLHLLIDPPDDLKVMQDEIFGPILPLRSVASMDEAIAFVNARPRPLGLYYFGKDRREEAAVLTRITAGGVTLNDVIFHVSVHDLPFGGIGASGMGAYHGIDGFRTFSHAKSVYRQERFGLTRLLRPPYGATYRREVARRISR